LLAHLGEDGADFINELDRWVSDKKELLSDSDGHRYGVSMFFFQEPEAANFHPKELSTDLPTKVA